MFCSPSFWFHFFFSPSFLVRLPLKGSPPPSYFGDGIPETGPKLGAFCKSLRELSTLSFFPFFFLSRSSFFPLSFSLFPSPTAPMALSWDSSASGWVFRHFTLTPFHKSRQSLSSFLFLFSPPRLVPCFQFFKLRVRHSCHFISRPRDQF